jgi:hypothetical protein
MENYALSTSQTNDVFVDPSTTSKTGTGEHPRERGL